ncbi:MAG: hypothetical protein ACM3PY_07625 [Omnitrophica WOR_2 bacterium]
MKSLPCLIFCLSFLVACAPEHLNPGPTAAAAGAFTPTPCAASQTAQAPAPSPKPDNPELLLNQLKHITDGYRAQMIANPGWLHLITRHSGPQGSDPLQGESADNSFEQEGWYQLNPQGETLAGAVRRLNTLGLSREITGGPWRRIQPGKENQLGLLDSLDAGSDFYQKINQFVNQGASLHKSTLYRNCWYIGEKYTLREGGTLHEAVFNPDNGKLVTLTDWDVSGASVTLIKNIDIVIEERAQQPSADVQALLR